MKYEVRMREMRGSRRGAWKWFCNCNYLYECDTEIQIAKDLDWANDNERYEYAVFFKEDGSLMYVA